MVRTALEDGWSCKGLLWEESRVFQGKFPHWTVLEAEPTRAVAKGPSSQARLFPVLLPWLK